MIDFERGDIVVMETHTPPLPDHFVIWRLADVSDPTQLRADIIGNDVDRSAALKEAVAASRGKRVFWYSREKDTFFEHHYM